MSCSRNLPGCITRITPSERSFHESDVADGIYLTRTAHIRSYPNNTFPTQDRRWPD